VTEPPPTATPPGRFLIREPVRWSDVDLAGIIFYGSYVRLFEIAETELFRAAGLPFSRLFEEFDLWLPRAALHFEFRRPARLDDLLDLEMWISRIGTSSLRLQFEVYRSAPERELTAEGYAVLVAVRRGELTPIPVPAEVVAALERFRGEAAPA
jgi:acyl-CoA thioester hydrolase